MYLVFAGYDYHPSGGWDDLIGKYDTPEEAVEAAELHDGDWAHIVDLATGEKIDL